MDLSSQWIAGFVDGVGRFQIELRPDPEKTVKYQVLPEFSVLRPQRDVQILFGLKSFFKCGVVRADKGDHMTYRVRSLNHLLTIINPFFLKHQLKTKRRLDFEKFRDVLLLMEKGEHETLEGMQRIRAIVDSMNTGAS